MELATTTFLRHDRPLNEHPEVVGDVPGYPYSTSKAAAFRDGMTRAAAGHDILFVIPGRHLRTRGMSVPLLGIVGQKWSSARQSDVTVRAESGLQSTG